MVTYKILYRHFLSDGFHIIPITIKYVIILSGLTLQVYNTNSMFMYFFTQNHNLSVSVYTIYI